MTAGYEAMTRANKKRAAAARAAGRDAVTVDVIESWPGCVQCVRPIRRGIPPPPDTERIGSFRGCGCPGRVWWSGTGPWEILVPGSPPDTEGSEPW